MTAHVDKPHLSRAHMLDLLKQMIRVRRFEDKCAELYTQEKIRGFLHLYDGEEAIAVGVIPVLEKRDRIVATYGRAGAGVQVGSYPKIDTSEYKVKVTLESKDRGLVEAAAADLIRALGASVVKTS